MLALVYPGAMPRSDAPPLTRGVVLRGVGLVIAVALAGAAAWLIVTSTSQKRLELGVLAGLWGALIGAFAMFGARRIVHPLDMADERIPGTGLELRSANFELERAEEAAARRAHEVRLEQMLRREIQAAMTREVAALRAEIADLRSELLEKVGGQLRLERIETTRVIGSDLEALQHEVRQLKAVAQDPSEMSNGYPRVRPGDTASVRPIVEPARVRPVTRHTAEVEAEVHPAQTPFESPPVYEPAAYEPQATQQPPIPAETTGPIEIDAQFRPVASTEFAAQPSPAPQPTVATPPTAAPAPAPAPVAATPAAPPSRPTPTPEPEPRPQPTPAAQEAIVLPLEPAAPPSAPTPPTPAPSTPAPSTQAPLPSVADELASLPRIRPFTDFELDPIESSYTGRRRRADPDESSSAGRHSRGADEPTRRHARGEDSDDDLLARLLARESSH